MSKIADETSKIAEQKVKNGQKNVKSSQKENNKKAGEMSKTVEKWTCQVFAKTGFCNFELFRCKFFYHKAYLQSKLNFENITLEKLQNLIRPYTAPY